MKNSFLHFPSIVFLLLSLAVKAQNPVWTEVATGVWKTTIGGT